MASPTAAADSTALPLFPREAAAASCQRCGSQLSVSFGPESLRGLSSRALAVAAAAAGLSMCRAVAVSAAAPPVLLLLDLARRSVADAPAESVAFKSAAAAAGGCLWPLRVGRPHGVSACWLLFGWPYPHCCC